MKTELEFTTKAGELRGFFLTLKPLVDEAKLRIEGGKLSSNSVDPAHVAMVSTELIVSVHPSQVTADSAPLEFGIDVEDAEKRLQAFDKKLPVLVRVTMKESVLEGGSVTFTQGRLSRTLKALDPSGMADPKVPKMDLPGLVNLPVEEILDALKVSVEVADHVGLRMADGRFGVFADDENGNADKTVWDPADAKGEGRSLFSTDYLRGALKGAKEVSDMVTIHLGQDYPVKIEAESASGNLKVSYLQAPRISDTSIPMEW